jgi:ribosomal protein L21E
MQLGESSSSNAGYLSRARLTKVERSEDNSRLLHYTATIQEFTEGQSVIITGDVANAI